MKGIFLQLLEMSITAGYVIAAVILLRAVFRKAPRWFHCILWAMAAVRLVFPFSIKSVLSIIPVKEVSPADIVHTFSNPATNGDGFTSVVNETLSGIGRASSGAWDLMQAASIIWVIGMGAMLIYGAMSYLRLKNKVSEAERVENNIYSSRNIPAPFILGMIKPGIYLPEGMDETEASYVIMHEKAHLKRRDHWIKPFGFLLLSIYWFNPLVWLAYILLCRDIELACDEAVMRQTGEHGKKVYSKVLLSCGTGRKTIAACPLAFGEVGLKQRISNVLNYRKPSFWIIASAVALCLIVGLLLLTNPREEKMPEFPKGDYVFDELIYMNPLSSYMVFEDTGELYIFDETGFTISGKETGQIIDIIEYENPEAVSINGGQWRELFKTNLISTPVGIDNYSSRYKWELSGTYSIYQMDDELWLMKTNGKSGVWSVYKIVPKPEGEIPNYNQMSVAPSYTQPLDRILSQLVIENNMERTDGGRIATSAHTILKIVEDDETLGIYVVAMYMGFDYKEGRLIEAGGSHMPVAVTLEKAENGGYGLIEYWEPEDGSGYMKSVIEKFPGDIDIDSVNTQKYVKTHIRACYESAVKGTGMDTDKYIGELIDIISSEPAQMSDVDSYIEENIDEYRQLLNYGGYTLDYCFDKFEEGGRTGLKGHIMAGACAEILADTMTDYPEIIYNNGQEWYEKIKPSLP